MAELDITFFRNEILSGAVLAREVELARQRAERARRVVAGAARDATDAALLLDMIGLLPRPEADTKPKPKPTAGPGAAWGLKT